ncbi:MAG: hypothetical protein EKK42_24025 [Pseudonocardiaceae bacterium]|nr:MAG: hypothetical protein EKK42_24025 [Pseudonocardiaceae bacterium]
MRYQQFPPPNPDPDRQPAPRQRRHPDTDGNAPPGPATPWLPGTTPPAGTPGVPTPRDRATPPAGPAATPPGGFGGTPPSGFNGTPPGGFAPGASGRHMHGQRARVGVRTPPSGHPAPGAPAPGAPTPGAPTRRDPVPPGARPGDATTRAQPDTAAPGPVSRAEYNLPKVIAGGGAAATTAAVGSYFGAAGTVVGAALAAIVTSVATTTFQRGLDTTTRTVRSRVVRLRRDDTGTEATAVMPALPAQRNADDPDATRAVADADGTIRLGDQGAGTRTSRFTPKRIAVMAGVAVVAFAIGLFVVTGIEWVKGSPISGGESGTSVGRVLRPASADSTAPTTTAPQDSESSRANDGRDSGTQSTQEPTQRSGPGGGSASRTTAPPTTTGAAPTAPRGGGVLPNLNGSGAGAGDSGSGSGGSGG